MSWKHQQSNEPTFWGSLPTEDRALFPQRGLSAEHFLPDAPGPSPNHKTVSQATSRDVAPGHQGRNRTPIRGFFLPSRKLPCQVYDLGIPDPFFMKHFCSTGARLPAYFCAMNNIVAPHRFETVKKHTPAQSPMERFEKKKKSKK